MRDCPSDRCTSTLHPNSLLSNRKDMGYLRMGVLVGKTDPERPTKSSWWWGALAWSRYCIQNKVMIISLWLHMSRDNII